MGADRIGKCKSYKEAVKFLMEEHGCSKIEILQLYEENEVLRMIDDDNRSEISQPISISSRSEDLSAESKNVMNFIIDKIKFTVNKYKEHTRFYSMINGEIYYVGRKIIYDGKRYGVVHYNETDNMLYLTDNMKFIKVHSSNVKIINENILFEEIGDLFEKTYSVISDKINLATYLEIFSYIYNMEVTIFITRMNKDMKLILKNHLEAYLMKRNLRTL